MSRAFNGTSDTVTFSAGDAPPNQGPITIIVLAKAANLLGFTGWMARGRKAGNAVWSALTSNNAGPKLFTEGDFGNGVAGLTTDWAYYAVSIAASGVPRWHVKNVTHDTAFVHANDTFTPNTGAGPIDDVIIGQSFPGSFAVVAAVADEWSDAEIEANCTYAATDLLAALGGAGFMVRFNQASTATPVPDDTGNGGDQSAISGTSIDADDPPGYDYSLAPPAPAEGAAAFTLNLAAAAAGGRPSAGVAALSLGIAPAALGGRPSTGTAALGLGLAVAATGANPAPAGTAAFTLNLAVAAQGGRLARSDQPRILTSDDVSPILSVTRAEPWEV